MEAEKRIGIVGVFLENMDRAEEVNAVIHEYNQLIVARLGTPYRKKNVAVIALIVDAENDDISAMTGRLGRIPDVSVKSMLQKG